MSTAALVRGFVILALAAAGCGGAEPAEPGPLRDCPAPAGPPYAASPRVEGLIWDFGGLIRLAPGSDLWPATWGPDDNVYAAWGDGGGFEGTETDGRVSLGFARIGGLPPDLSPRNVWGGKDAQSPATFSGKPTGMLSAGETLYAWVLERPAAAPTDVWVASSGDLGRSWQRSADAFPGVEGGFYPTTFLNYGRDYEGARDGFAYAYGKRWSAGAAPFASTDAYLARAPMTQIADPAAYEFFAGLDERCRARWTATVSSALPVVSDPSGIDAPQVVYVQPLGRYVATTARAQQVGKLIVLDALEPWGPWTTVAAYDNWGGFGTSQSLGYSIPTKWIEADGRTFWMVFSATGELDAFNLVRGTLALRED